MTLLKSLSLSTAALALATSLSAAELAAPEGDVILTVTGNIATMNTEDSAQFDMAALMAMEPTTFATTTPWTEGTTEFTGVELADLVELLGVTGGVIKATAINDYTIDIPLTDAVEGGALIAYHRDGEEMSVRDKGPLWVVYPYDLNDEYQSETAYSRSIWQLDRMSVVDE